MEIIKANETHIPAIIAIANITWQDTYKNIITQEQISYMLNLFYTQNTLRSQMQDPLHHFWVLLQHDEVLGYAHCIEDKNEATVFKLSKLYVLPQYQGKGIGKCLLFFIENECYELKKNIITLNVNRQNPAKDFYLKMGFEIVKEVDIPLDKYWLNDYIMEKKLEI